MKDSTGTTAFFYNLAHQLTSISYPGSNTLTLSYWNNGLRKEENLNSGTYRLLYEYDALNRLKKIHDYVANNDILYTYDYNPGTSYYSLGNLVKIAYPNGATTEYEYLECCSRIGSIVTKNGSQQIIESYEYEYDLAGNRTRTDLMDGSFIGYQYDDLNRLSAAGRRLGVTWLWTRQYSYDRVGNVQQLIWRQGGAPDTLTYAYYPSTNLLKTALGKTYTYDQNGNPISCSDGRSFTYDFENRLLRLTSSGYQADYAYNGFGDRIKKTHQTFASDMQKEVDAANLPFMMSADKNKVYPEQSRMGPDVYYNDLGDMSESRSLTTNEYVYDDLGRQIYWKRTIDGNVTNVYYTHGYGMEARRVGASVNHYMHSDILGSITSITNASGNTLSTYEYDPYGIMLSGNTNVLGNFGFTGQEIDLDVSLYHFPARYYEPYWGRFLTADPIREKGFYEYFHNIDVGIVKYTNLYTTDFENPTELNLYPYANNDPTNSTDPLGLFVMAFATDMPSWWFEYRDINRMRDIGWEYYHDNSFMRHCVISCMVAQRWGIPHARLAGYGNEMQGLILHDLRNIFTFVGRLAGRAPWSFQIQDLQANEIGFRCAGSIECKPNDDDLRNACDACCGASQSGTSEFPH